MDLVPVDGKALLKVACPPPRGAAPRMVVPFCVNVTVPIGVPPNCGVTVAVNVTDCPIVEGFGDKSRVVVVVSLTTWLKVGEVLGVKFVLPTYVAVMDLVWPEGKTLSRVAFPPLSVAVPMAFAPLKKLTVPLGVLGDPDTVAVKATDWPALDGFGLEDRVVVVQPNAGTENVPRLEKLPPAPYRFLPRAL